MSKQLKINNMKNLNYKTMRRLVFSLLMFLTLSLNAQVKFLGIPVDGPKSEMIPKLTQKGYIYNIYRDYLMGEFNGSEVRIKVVEYNGKVGRIIVEDSAPSNEIDIIIRYNNLIDQFERNEKYVGENEKINNKANINSEMYKNHKRFEAVYYQKDEDDKAQMMRKVWFKITRADNSKFKILLFYDNVSNMPNGEDL